MDKRLISLDEDISRLNATVKSAAVKIKKLQAEVEQLKAALEPILHDMETPECPENEPEVCEICQSFIRYAHDIRVAIQDPEAE